MVIGDDSCLKGCQFKSRHHILDGHVFTLICCKNFIVCLKRPKIKKPGLVHCFLKNVAYVFDVLRCDQIVSVDIVKGRTSR